jgi:arginyl-tRNA synthetase
MNVYHYFRTSLYNAISLVYPHLQLKQYPITFKLTKQQYGDLCTPVARQIAFNENVSCTEMAKSILHTLETNPVKEHTQKPAQSNILNGFINFRLIRSFLNFKTVSVCSKKVSHLDENQYCRIFFEYPELKKAYKQLVSSSGIIEEIEKADPGNLIFNEEVFLMREIALTEPQEIISGNGSRYFCRRLCRTFNRFYRNCPLYTSDAEQTRARFLLMKAFYNRMIFLWEKGTVFNDF